MMKFSKLLSVFLVALFGFLELHRRVHPRVMTASIRQNGCARHLKTSVKILRKPMQGKRLLLLLEQRGCIYCDKMFRSFPT